MAEHDQTSTRGPFIPHDRLFKELLGAFLYEFLELFLPDLAERVEPESLVLLDKELFPKGEKSRRADLVAQARVKEGREASFLIHCEHEAQNRKPLLFPRRMLQYVLLLHDNTGMAVYPIALFSYPRPRRTMASSYRITCPGFETLRFRYRTIQLNRLDWRDYAQRPNPVAVALMSRMHIKPEDRPKVRLACLRLLRRLNLETTKAMLVSQFFDCYLWLDPQESEQFRAELSTIPPEEREAVLEITTSWEREGRQKGMQEGAGKALLTALEKRFGSVPDELRERLGAVEDPTVLISLVGDAVSAATIEEFAARLPG